MLETTPSHLVNFAPVTSSNPAHPCVLYFAGWTTVITPFSVVLAFTVSVAVGLLFGVYRNRKAARLQRLALEARTFDLVDGHRVPRSRYPLFMPADADTVAAAMPGADVQLEVSGTALAGCPAGGTCLELPANPDQASHAVSCSASGRPAPRRRRLS